MKKFLLILPIFWWSLVTVFGQAVSITPVGGGVVRGLPGSVSTVVLEIKNLTTAPVQLRPQWQLPAGWNAISDDLPFTLGAGATNLRLMSVHIAPGATAGFFSVQYNVFSQSEAVSEASVSVPFEVPELSQVFMAPAEVPEMVEAGTTVSATFILQNQGNATRTFEVSTESCELVGPPFYELEPNQTATLAVRAKTDATIRYAGQVFLRVFAKQTDLDTTGGYAYAFVRVVPKSSYEIVEGQQLPMAFTLSHLTRKWNGGQTASGFQGEFYTNGSLDEAGEKQVEMRLRGPDRFGLSQLGQYDEYFARYEDKKYYLFAGDKTYTLTPLTEFARYARGVEVGVKNGKFETGGFYHRPRFYPDVREVGAGYLRYHFNEKNQAGLAVMRKYYQEGGEAADLLSLYGTFEPLPNIAAEAEISNGNRAGVNGTGLFLRVNARPFPKLQLNSNLIAAGKFFPGYFTNTTSINGQANFQATPKLNFFLLYNQDERNASRDTLFGLAPYSTLAQVGLGYQLFGKVQLQVFLRRNEMEDRMPALKFHYLENVVRLELSKNWRRLSATLTSEAGKRENLLLPLEERESQALRSFLNLSYRYSHRHSVQAFAQYYQYHRSGAPESNQWIFGGSFHSEVGPFTKLQLSFQTSYLLEEYYRNRNLFDFRFNQKIGQRKNHELAASVNYVLLQRTQESKDFSMQLSYTYRFGVRTAGKKMSQNIYGRIENKGVESVGGIVLSLNGQTAVTAADGSFAFKNVPAGSHFLMLDPTSVRLHDITTQPMPVQVVLEPGKDTTLLLGLTRSVSLFGNIDVEPEKKPTKLNGKEERPKVFMFEISNGTETFRRLTDAQQRVEFPDIRPGKWTLRVINPDSYRGFYFEKTAWELDLQPEMVKDLNIKLLRKKKEIKFQEKLSLTSAGG